MGLRVLVTLLLLLPLKRGSCFPTNFWHSCWFCSVGRLHDSHEVLSRMCRCVRWEHIWCYWINTWTTDMQQATANIISNRTEICWVSICTWLFFHVHFLNKKTQAIERVPGKQCADICVYAFLTGADDCCVWRMPIDESWETIAPHGSFVLPYSLELSLSEPE